MRERLTLYYFLFQLNCVGGSAAGAFVPQVVQCTNMGSDGYDVQVKFYTIVYNKARIFLLVDLRDFFFQI